MADSFSSDGCTGRDGMSVAHLVLAGGIIDDDGRETRAALAVIAALLLASLRHGATGSAGNGPKLREEIARSATRGRQVGCANRVLTPRRTRASPSEMAMSVVQAAVAPARLTVPTRARTRALPARTRALPARRARVAPRASADGAAEEVAEEVKEALDGSSLFLVGMMGTGKSSVGKKLAASLGYSFFDTCVPRRRCPASVRPGPALSKNTSPTVERHRPSVARP